MANDIAAAELRAGHAFDALQAIQGVYEAALVVFGQVNLGRVAGGHDFRTVAHAREEHLHLRNGRVLRLVENDEGIIQRPAPHVGQWNDLDQVLLAIAVDLFVVHHFVQGVHQRSQVRIDLCLQVARQEAEVFTGLDCGPHQHELADPLGTQGGHRRGHGQIGLAGSGRSVAKHDVVLGDSIEILGLTLRAGTDLPARGENRQWPGCRSGRRRFALLYPGKHAIDVFGGKFTVALGLSPKFLQHLGGAGHGLLLALDVDAAIPGGNRNRQRLADLPHVLIAGAEKR